MAANHFMKLRLNSWTDKKTILLQGAPIRLISHGIAPNLHRVYTNLAARFSIYQNGGVRMKIRPAQFEDALPMARVFVDTFLSVARDHMSEEAFQKRKQEWPYEMFANNWQKTMVEIAEGVTPLICICVAEDETGEVVGFSLGCPSKDKEDPAEVGQIDLLYVRESHQRKGIGRALAQAAAAHLARLGMTRLHILTPVDHTQGRQFYDKLGGQVVGTRDDHDDGEVIPLVIYEWPDMQAFADMDNHPAQSLMHKEPDTSSTAGS
jgi:GNAT superfamily N-acetyltransferase